MSDEAIRSALRRALSGEARPGFSDRLADHCVRVARGDVEPPAARVSLRAVAGTVALAAMLAAGGVVVLQHRTASHLSTPPGGQATQPAAVSSASNSSTASSTSQATAVATAAARASATPAATASGTPSPPPDCQGSDLSASLSTGTSSTYPVGASIPVSETITNHSNNPCQLPLWCTWWWHAFNSAGQAMPGAGPPAAGDCSSSEPHQVLAAGASLSTSTYYPSSWQTSSSPAGTYTIRANLNGLASATGTVTLVGNSTSSSSTSASTSTSSSSTSVLP